MRKIISFLKHLFIPHKENNYKPHFFREHVVLSILIGSLLLLLVSFTSYTVIRTTKFGSTIVASVLIDLTNQTRKKYDLPPLARNQKLDTAATFKGHDMVDKEYFSHFAPDGTTPWHWFDVAGYRFSYAGENLAINFKNSQEVQKAWLASKKHRDNILDKRYEDIGIAVVQDAPHSVPVIFVVQMFGKLASSSPVSEKAWDTAKMYEKLLFDAPFYVAKIYLFLIILIIIALFMMIFIEIKKQHYLHILFGILLIIIVSICIIINSYLF